MALVEITVTKHRTGRLLVRQSFTMTDEMALAFVERLNKMLTGLDRPVRARQTNRPDGQTQFIINVGGAARPPPSGPTFEESYRRALPAPGGRHVEP